MPSPNIPFNDGRRFPHIVLLPGAGMGHVTPFLRLAVALSGRGCDVSLVITRPTVSDAESRHFEKFLSAFPRVRPLWIDIPLLDQSDFPNADPFFLRCEAIRRSAHLLGPLLSSSEMETAPPVSALVIDIFLVSTFVPVAANLDRKLRRYVLFTSSAMMLSFHAHFSNHVAEESATAGIGDVDVPGARRVPKASVPSPLHDQNHLFTKQFVDNGRVMIMDLMVDGILVNTFGALEPDVLSALKSGKVIPELPPVFAIGPLQPLLHSGEPSTPAPFLWLDEQPDRSVVYVSFGSRTAMSADQIKELGIGLERSGCRFLWVVKTTKVDREEVNELEELLGASYLQRVKGRGLILNAWVEQQEILAHRAVGGFVSHCGWNSVTEAVMHGVKVLACPQLGDQRINAEIVAGSGLGVWREKWNWLGGSEVVKGEEIGELVKEMMADEGLRASAERLSAEAAKAMAAGGSSHQEFTCFIIGLLHV